MTIERFHTGPRMSKAVIAGDRIYLSGLTAGIVEGKSVGEQTADILAQIDALIEETGASRSDIYRATIWLRDIATFDEMNAVWDAWVVPGKTPVRATVEAKLADPDILVEIQVEALRSVAP